jgi:hypothetical protein
MVLRETEENLSDAVWLVEASHSGGTTLHGPFDTRHEAAEWATSVLLYRSMYGSRTVSIRPILRPIL